MKIPTIFICLFVGVGLADATIQIKPSQDKPSQIYVANDSQNINSTTYTTFYAWEQGLTNPYFWEIQHISSQSGHTWSSVSGGSGSSYEQDNATCQPGFEYGTFFYDAQLYYGFDYTTVSEQMTWNTPNQGIETDNSTGYSDFNPGYQDLPYTNSPAPYSIGPPGIGYEYCEVNDPEASSFNIQWYDGGGDYIGTQNGSNNQTYQRHAQTKMTLQTGGKSIPDQMALFLISGWAQNASGSLRATPPYGTNSTLVIPAQNITIGKLGNLDTNGNRYVALYNNTEVDVTPQVAGDNFYTFGVGEKKYTPTIIANGNDLSVTNPEFCVGQQVNFVLNWSTSTPPIVNMVGNWNLPGEFVNQQTNYSSTCTTYDINNSLLLNTNQTSCWFVNGQGGKVVVGMNLLFTNGQYASIAEDGNITIYRPTATMSSIQEPRYYTLSNTNLPATTLKLGDQGGVSDNGTMLYKVNVNSKYNGNANFTQLITADYSNPAYIFSVERCDGTEFYNDPSTRIIGSGIIGLGDGPSDTWVTPDIVNLSARDFVRFQPDGGIYVTLGIVTWDTVGTAEQSFSGNWSITTDTTPDPSGPDSSDAFPVWTQSITAH